MNILALDLGTKTGWAFSNNGAFASGTKNFSTNKTAARGLRFLNFRRWLAEILTKRSVDLVVFEDVMGHIGTYAAHAYGGFVAHLTALCEEKKIPYRGFYVKTIKKFIACSGNASKEDVIAAVERKGFRPIDDNEADSIAILLLALDTPNLQFELK